MATYFAGSQRRFGMLGLRSDRQGAVAAEFAMILPVLMLIFFGIIKFGIALNHNLALTDGVRAGARQFAIGRSSPTVWADTVSRFLNAAPGLAEAKVELTVSVNGSPCNTNASCGTALKNATGQPATMLASYPCDLVIMGKNFAPDCRLSSQTTERVE